MKKHQNFFDHYFDQVCDVTDMLKKEGHSSAECRYKKIMATILLFIRSDLRAIRVFLLILLGSLLGLLLRFLLETLKLLLVSL